MLAGPPLVGGCGWRLAACMLVLETRWLSCDLHYCVLGVGVLVVGVGCGCLPWGGLVHVLLWRFCWAWI